MSWLDADGHCEDVYQTNLATITTDEDLQIALILKNIRNVDDDHKDLWIGLTDLSVISDEGHWIWSDGTKWYVPFVYVRYVYKIHLCTLYIVCHSDYVQSGRCDQDKHWDEGKPDDRNGEDCAEIDDSNSFNDEDCEIENHFLCNNRSWFTTTTSPPSPTPNPLTGSSKR